MALYSKIYLHLWATVAKEVLHGDHKNCDWSAWAACVFSYKFLMPIEIADRKNSSKQVYEKTFFSNTHLANIYLHCKTSVHHSHCFFLSQWIKDHFKAVVSNTVTRQVMVTVYKWVQVQRFINCLKSLYYILTLVIGNYNNFLVFTLNCLLLMSLHALRECDYSQISAVTLFLKLCEWKM